MSINNLPPNIIPKPSKANGTNTGCSTTCFTVYLTDASLIPSSSHRQTSQAFFIWGICSTILYKTSWCVVPASKVKRHLGTRHRPCRYCYRDKSYLQTRQRRHQEKRPYTRRVSKTRMGLDGNTRRHYTQTTAAPWSLMRLGTHGFHNGCSALRSRY